LGVRNEIEGEGILRVIEIEGADLQPCGGTRGADRVDPAAAMREGAPGLAPGVFVWRAGRRAAQTAVQLAVKELGL